MPKGRRWTDEERKEIRAAYFALPRTSGHCVLNKGRRRKWPGGRVAKGFLQPLLKRFGISEAVLWKMVYEGQPWNST